MKRILLVTLGLWLLGAALAQAESGFRAFGSSATFVSDLGVQDGNVVISTTTGSKGLVFQDGSVLTSSAPISRASSSTVVTSWSTTGTTGNTCIAGSTVTISTSFAARYQLSMDVVFQNTNAADNAFAPLIDGQYAAPLNATHGMADHRNNSNLQEYHTGFNYLTDTLSAGTHSFCVLGWTDAGTLSLPTGHALYFSAMEVR